MAMSKEAMEKELIRGIVGISRTKEFYGHIIQQFEKVYVHFKRDENGKPDEGQSREEVIPTAAVGRYPGDRFLKLYLNTDFFAEMYDGNSKDKAWKQMTAVLEHEILHCFPVGTMVGGSFLPIEKMVKGGTIIGSDGCRHEAEEVDVRNYSGGMVTIKPTGVLGFDVTDNHRILVADIGWKTVNTEIPRRNIRLIKDVDWKNSQDVKKGDWLAVPRMKGNRNDISIDVSSYMRGNEWSLPVGVRGGSIPLNEDTAWLMGYYCAEGSASAGTPRGVKPAGSGQVTFSMHRKEEKTHGVEVARIVEKWSLGSGCLFMRPSKNSSVMCFYSTVMARMLREKVGHKAHNKRVPEEIFWNKDDRIVKAFLRGYFDGDGAVASKSFAAATVSRVLACQIQMMSARLGAWLNVHFYELSKNPPRVIVSGPPRKIRDQYCMNSGGDDIRFTLGYDAVEDKGRPTKHHVTTDEFVFVRVRKVSRRKWSGKVYNLRSPTRDYLVNNVVVHNCVLGHLFMKFSDRTRANVAMDCSVNSYLDKDSMPENHVNAKMYGFEDGKSAMWYYTHLQNNEQFKKQCANGNFGKGGLMSHIMSSHGLWKDAEEDVVAKEFIKDIIRKSSELCNKNYGNIHQDLIAQIDELLKGEKAIVPWAKVLRMFVASCAESILDYTIKRISRRYACRPGTRKGDVLKLAVAVDTSGSISDDELKIFFNEIRWIWKNGAIIDIIECDCSISTPPYRFKGKWNGKVHGRGGTDLEPPLKLAEGKYDALIYFTDFCAPKISHRYKLPVLWVLTTDMDKNEYPYPWGRHIKIEGGRARAA